MSEQNAPRDDRGAARAGVGEEEVEVRKQRAERGVPPGNVLVAQVPVRQLLQLLGVVVVGWLVGWCRCGA
jgi:hypothetical protein